MGSDTSLVSVANFSINADFHLRTCGRDTLQCTNKTSKGLHLFPALEKLELGADGTVVAAAWRRIDAHTQRLEVGTAEHMINPQQRQG